MNRRALLLSALAAALVPVPAEATAFLTIRVDVKPLIGPVNELCELLPLAADCDVGTRSRLVELFEHGNRFFEVLQLEQCSALGAVERTIVLQPSDLLVLCVSALAGHGQGRSIHQSHMNSSVGRVATPTLDGRAPGVEPPQMPGRGYSSRGAVEGLFKALIDGTLNTRTSREAGHG